MVETAQVIEESIGLNEGHEPTQRCGWRRGVLIAWLKESVRVEIRVIVKRIRRKYTYPPDKQERTHAVLAQAELLVRGLGGVAGATKLCRRFRNKLGQ